MDSIPVTFMSCSKVCIPLTAPSAVYCPLSLFKRRDRSYTYIFEGFRTSNYNSMKYVVRNTWNSIIIIIFFSFKYSLKYQKNFDMQRDV